MVAPPDASPGRLETSLAYAGAALSSLVWVGCVIPGVRVAAGVSDDAWTPMGRPGGALLIVPALLLLVAGPVATVLARGPIAHRAILAAGDAFVTWFMAGALFGSRRVDPALVLVVGALVVMGLVAIRDTVVVLRAGADAGTGAVAAISPRYTDLRLALSVLALLTPASLLASPDRERASLLAPFVYVAISALGERFARTERGLRLTGAVLLSLVAAHLVIALHYVLDADEADGWTWAGTATFGLACAVFAGGVARTVAIARGPKDAPA